MNYLNSVLKKAVPEVYVIDNYIFCEVQTDWQIEEWRNKHAKWEKNFRLRKGIKCLSNSSSGINFNWKPGNQPRFQGLSSCWFPGAREELVAWKHDNKKDVQDRIDVLVNEVINPGPSGLFAERWINFN